MKALSVFFVVGLLCIQCSVKEDLPPAAEVAVIPQPSTLAEVDGEFVIDSETSILVMGESEMEAANYLAAMITRASAFTVPVAQGDEIPAGKVIVLQIKEDTLGPEGYELNVSPGQILISAPGETGLFYGVQTLRQLLPASIEKNDTQAATWTVPAVFVRDEPLYAWRGMHLDVSRHFFSVDFIRQFIDRLALYKLNRLHLHLTDDQGWRLQINKYPELTDQGAWRVLNNQDSACLKRAATNPDFALPEEFFRDKDGVRQYGGFYTQDEIKEIVAYAAQRHITIVPEIDMPGHMNAAINAFPELTCVEQGGWGDLFTIPICPCEESTYEFIENVLTEVATLFPGEYIHIGADEVDEKTWQKAAQCSQLVKREGLNSTKELHSYFVNRVNKIVRGLGKKAIGWDEIIDGDVDPSIAVMYWRGWVADAPVRAAGSGHEVIMSPTSHCYFDYEPDRNTLERMYHFNPVPEGMAAGDQARIIGLQANIWTEYIPTPARLDYMTMPRMIALAEVGWSKEKTAWDVFSSRLSHHYPRLDELGIHYRLQDIANIKEHTVFIDSAVLDLAIPGGVTGVRYTTDGTEPGGNSMLYKEPLRIDSSMTLKLLSLGYEGRPGNRYTIRLEKQRYLPAVSAPALTDGVICRYYEGSYSSVSGINPKDLRKQTVTNKVTIPAYSRPSVFALEYDGFIDIPAEGIYTFYLSSDDGSTLQIGDRPVIDNDGYHSEQEVSGQVALAKGLHPFLLRYFDGGGGNALHLEYEGPAIEKQEIAGAMFKTVSR